ncbi:MAG: hypothetical protein KG003_14840 [Bacteroidetes bacterium]|nr:hypothetical protein [Bacteroidota bacterium]
MKRVSTIFITLVFIIPLFGQTRKYVNEFMHIGVGARQFGMGKAGVAGTADVYSCYWNPAGLSHMDQNLQVGFMHNFYFQNIANFDYLGIAAKSGKNSAFGFSFLRFGVDGILNTLDLIQNGEINYARVKEFSAIDYCFMPAYSQKMRLRKMPSMVFSWGVTTKLVHRKVGEFARAWGFGIDGGLRLEDIDKKWGLALVARDITGTYNNWQFQFTDAQKDVLQYTGNTIPKSSLEVATPRFCFGGYRLFEGEKFFGSGEANLDVTTDGQRNTLISSKIINADLRAGLEGGIKNEDKNFRFMLRLGVYNFQRELKQNGKFGRTVQPTTGIGLQFDNLHLDYALAGFGAGGSGLYSNILSLRFDIKNNIK